MLPPKENENALKKALSQGFFSAVSKNSRECIVRIFAPDSELIEDKLYSKILYNNVVNMALKKSRIGACSFRAIK